MANQTNAHTAAKASGVPSFIEFVSDDARSCDADDDCDLLDIDFHHNAHEAPAAEAAPKDAAVTRRELDAMKKMVHDMRRNPELLHLSPAYSHSRASPLFRSMGSASTPYSHGAYRSLATPNTQKSYCQECHSSSGPTHGAQGGINLADLPPPPFRFERGSMISR